MEKKPENIEPLSRIKDFFDEFRCDFKVFKKRIASFSPEIAQDTKEALDGLRTDIDLLEQVIVAIFVENYSPKIK